MFVVGIALFTARLARGRARAVGGVAAGRPRGAGRRRGDRRPLDARAADDDLPRGPRAHARGRATTARSRAAAAASVSCSAGCSPTWLSWRWGLFINVPDRHRARDRSRRASCPRPSAARGRFDLTGAITSTLGMTAIVYGFVRAASDGWSDRLTLASFAAGACCSPPSSSTSARRAADHAAAPVREPRALGRLRRPRAGRRRDVLDVLLPHAVPAGRRRLQRAEAGLAFLPMTIVMFAMVRVVPRSSRGSATRRLLIGG